MKNMKHVILTAVAGLAASVNACPPEECNITPASAALNRAYAQADADDQALALVSPEVVRIVRIKNQNGKDISIEDRNGVITVTIDGKPIPADRVSMKDDTVEIRDDKGDVILTEKLPPAPPVPPAAIAPLAPLAPVSPAFPGNASRVWSRNSAAQRPKLGITMDEASSDVLEHLGLDPDGEYAMIDEVYEDMPAQRAGLKARDIIVSVDGQTPATTELIRETLAKKKTGETIVFDIVRKGQREKITATLDADSNGKVQRHAENKDGDAAGNKDIWLVQPGITPGVPRDTNSRVDWEAWAKQMEERAKEFGARGEAFGKDLADRLLQEFQSGKMNFAVPRGEGQRPMMLQLQSERERELEEQLKQMEQQLRRMEEQLRRMEQRLSPQPVTPSGGTTPSPAPYSPWLVF